MDIGVLVTTTAESGDLTAVARRAEALGFASLWIPEHPVIPVGHTTPFPGAADGALPDHYNRWADPFIALTVAAGVTNRIKLGTGICLLPERDPLMTAKVIASLDLYSNGRVILGIGGGWLREETEIMGTSFRLRWRRLRETVEAMRLLWTQQEASYDGELVQFPAVRCEPKPVQPNGPPVLLGAHGPKALERVARSYDGWFPLAHSPQALGAEIEELRKLVKEAGRDPDSVPVTPLRWRRLRETVEAMRLLWTQQEASYDGELVQFPAVRCEPKPVQPNGPPVLLGAHGPKALERVARSYDGWFPLAHSPQALGAEIEELQKLVKEAGRDPDSVPVTPIIDPDNGNLSADTLKRYQDAGVAGVVVFNQQMGTEISDGKAHEWLDRVAPIVGRAQGV